MNVRLITLYIRTLTTPMTERMATLADLVRGDTAKIIEIRAEGTMRQRLLDFGFRPGEIVKVVRMAPLADPIELSIRGSYLALRRSEASLISIEKQT
jgi:ferrous iron transport protein A